MNTRTKRIVLIGLVLILAVAFYAYRMYNKPHINVAESDVVASLTANDLFNKFDSDENAATVAFADKVVEVSGTVYAVDLSNELEPQVTLSTEDPAGFVRCEFKPDEKEKLTALSAGQPISIKGLCKGFNASDELDLLADKDVIMAKCIIIE